VVQQAPGVPDLYFEQRMEETTLIHLARRGNLEAFNSLVLAYQDRLYCQAYRLLGNAQSAEDATQEAFLSAYRKLEQFRGTSFRTWLLRIVTNWCYDELRRLKRRPTEPLEPTNFQDQLNDSAYWIVDPNKLPEEVVILNELDKTLQTGLKQLPTGFRTAVLLVDIQG